MHTLVLMSDGDKASNTALCLNFRTPWLLVLQWLISFQTLQPFSRVLEEGGSRKEKTSTSIAIFASPELQSFLHLLKEVVVVAVTMRNIGEFKFLSVSVTGCFLSWG